MKQRGYRLAGTIAGALCVGLFAVLPARAQDYPSRPIHLVTIFVPGSTGDLYARVLGSSLQQVTGQPVVVENVAGAGGAVASERVSRATPDGHTLLVTIAGTHVLRGFLTRAVSFDAVADFTPVTTLVESITYVISSTAVPAGSLRELIQYARANPGKVAYGSSGIGSPTHLVGETLKELTGAQIVHVPYKAIAQTLQDTVSGQLQMSFVIGGGVRAAIKTGKVRVIAVTGDRKDPRMPEVPTLAEGVPGYEPVPNWTGLFAPKGMAPALLARVHADVAKSINAPEARQKLLDAEAFPAIDPSPEAFAARLKREVALAGRIVKSVGIKPQD